MKFPLRSQTDTWHKNVDADIGSDAPCLANGSINLQFPWASVRVHTDNFVKKKGKLSAEEEERRLVGLVCQHHNTVNALAACAHRLSPTTISACLTGTFGQLAGVHLEITGYLRAIIVINHVNHSAVTESDAAIARNLLPLCGLDTSAAGQVLETVAKLWISGVHLNSVIRDEIESITSTACRDLKTRLEHLASTGYWADAAKEASRIPCFSAETTPTSSQRELIRILSKDFPTWRAWAAWRPKSDRLKFWERLTAQQRVSLKDILALKGPDFQCELHQTLEHHMHTCKMELSSVGPIQLPQNMPREAQLATLRRVVDVVDDACNGGQEEIELLIRLIDQVFTETQLSLFSAVHAVADPVLCTGVLELMQPLPDSEKLLPLLSILKHQKAEPVKVIIEGPLVEALKAGFKEKRRAMAIKVRDGKRLGAEGHLMISELQRFGWAQCEAEWYMQKVKPKHFQLLKNWPTTEVMTILFSLREMACSYPSTSLPDLFDRYFAHRFIKPHAQQQDFQVAETMIETWCRQSTPSSSVRRERYQLSLVIAAGFDLDTLAKCRCIAQLPKMSEDLARRFLSIVQVCHEQPVRGFVDLTRLLSSGLDLDVMNSWRAVLVGLTTGRRSKSLLRQLLDTVSVESWLEMLRGLRTIFHDEPSWDSNNASSVLHPSLRAWGKFLEGHLETIKKVQSVTGISPALFCILTGGERSDCSAILGILEALSSPTFSQRTHQALPYKIVGHLEADAANADMALKALTTLQSMGSDALELSARMVACQDSPLPPTGDIILAATLHSEDLSPKDKLGLQIVAEVLGINLTESLLPSPGSLELTDEYLFDEIEELLEEAKRLEGLRLAFRNRDPAGMYELCYRLGIEDTLPLDDMMVDLPPELVDVIDRVSDTEVEIQFPLTQLSTFTRTAMGAASANSLILRLQVDKNGVGFCMHFDETLRAASAKGVHSLSFKSYDVSMVDRWLCDARATPALAHLSRALHRHLCSAPANLGEIHLCTTTTISNLPRVCIICGALHCARLQRSSPCALTDCQLAFSSMRLDVCLADIRQDPAVVDLLITAIYAASTVGASIFNILPDHPTQPLSAIRQLLNNIPPIALLQVVKCLEQEISQLQKGTGDLLVWILTAFRGYLVSATGSLKIPSLPGAHQFLLANTNPEKEREFLKRINSGQPRRIFFHGTTMDRLYAILCQGLKELSGTALQRNGAQYGNAIYMADEPKTAWSYSQTYISGWKNSKFSNFRVLLGCEYVGTASAAESSRGIYVIKDAAQLMVRYIFLMPSNGTVPVARHLVPAMEIVLANLGAGTL